MDPLLEFSSNSIMILILASVPTILQEAFKWKLKNSGKQLILILKMLSSLDRYAIRFRSAPKSLLSVKFVLFNFLNFFIFSTHKILRKTRSRKKGKWSLGVLLQLQRLQASFSIGVSGDNVYLFTGVSPILFTVWFIRSDTRPSTFISKTSCVCRIPISYTGYRFRSSEQLAWYFRY